MSDETKEKIRKSLSGRVLTDEHKKKISENHHDVSRVNNPFYGKPTKTSFKEGKYHPRSQQVTIDGIEYGSLTQASKALVMTRGGMIKKGTYLNDEKRPLFYP